jgi:predicted dehydrogenase
MESATRKLKMGLIGGAGAGFIGRVHAVAATMDGRAELVAGALSSDPDRSRAAAIDYSIPTDRAYGSYGELLERESQLPANERIDFVTIATPNHTHFPIAQAALQSGFNVVCDKPLTTNLPDAVALAELVEKTGAVFVVAHAYTGYPLVRQAREMIRRGELGEIQAWRVCYIQGGLRRQKPGETPPRGAWKSDPAKAGPSGTMADIGTHAFHLARYVSGLVPSEVSCQLRTYFPERQLDDYGHVVLRCSNGALGTITVSQVTHGRLNDLTIEVDGNAGSMLWRQEEPDQLVLRRFGHPVQVFECNPRDPRMYDQIRHMCRLPGGHPEGLLEAFGNLYLESYEHMIARANGEPFDARQAYYPTVSDGLQGMQFVEQCVASSRQNGAWQEVG